MVTLSEPVIVLPRQFGYFLSHRGYRVESSGLE
jgi:hypothetical protein